MPAVRKLLLASAAAAAVPVLSALLGLEGWVPDAAGVVALLITALTLVLYVHRPVPRWALAAGVVLLAAASTVRGFAPSSVPDFRQPSSVDYRQALAFEDATAVLLVPAVAALLVGIVALPQFRRPAGLTALACGVALLPVVAVAAEVADERAGSSSFAGSQHLAAHLAAHLAPGLLATGLAGLAAVLAVSRADRWFLAPAGALLVQAAVAHTTRDMAGSWYLGEVVRGVEATSAFLQPGLRADLSAGATAGISVDFRVGAALAMAALLLGPVLIAAGAARTAGGPGPASAAGEDVALG
ncbi:hypothetical protein GCM10020358_17220 [Amorphoplanes nipponensis]|uniref:Uncharacterized protein n=1 Tax=Actinoplanes nipponensis TaxID=135950 RepID=A0A919MMK1_9ACTN|nr:hypothetical protein [Actinoplanes nipponensis]GIE50631.1 hypothetical protein Ani05nite_41650 [Actinoplanes nipponensis]